MKEQVLKRLLLVEDNRDVAGIIFDFFEAQGVVLDYADNGELGLKLAREQDFDAIILDLMLPRMDGRTLCKALRQEGKRTPVLMLTALGSREDTLIGFDCGADDYLAKPFDLDILQARLCALVRRYRGQVTPLERQFGELVLNPRTRTATRQGRPLALNPTTYTILDLLCRSAPEIVTRETLCDTLWPDGEPNNEVLRSHIYQLRNQLDRPFAIPMLVTVPKIGFRLEIPES